MNMVWFSLSQLISCTLAYISKVLTIFLQPFFLSVTQHRAKEKTHPDTYITRSQFFLRLA